MFGIRTLDLCWILMISVAGSAPRLGCRQLLGAVAFRGAVLGRGSGCRLVVGTGKAERVVAPGGPQGCARPARAGHHLVDAGRASTMCATPSTRSMRGVLRLGPKMERGAPGRAAAGCVSTSTWSPGRAPRVGHRQAVQLWGSPATTRRDSRALSAPASRPTSRNGPPV